MRIENTILSNLIHNEEYCRKVLPFLKKRYFSDRKEAMIFEEINKFFDTYNKPATQEILQIEAGSRKDMTDTDFNDAMTYISGLNKQDTNSQRKNNKRNYRSRHNLLFVCFRHK